MMPQNFQATNRPNYTDSKRGRQQSPSGSGAQIGRWGYLSSAAAIFGMLVLIMMAAV